jgi:hypothetical protein
MWLGGVLPYFNLIPPARVYFGMFPSDWLGVNGNDFMWNGFLIALGIKRVVPLELQPTYHYFWFNLYVILYWLSFIPTLGWAVLKGRQTAFLKLDPLNPKLNLERLKIILLAGIWLIIDLALARFLVWIYT